MIGYDKGKTLYATKPKADSKMSTETEADYFESRRCSAGGLDQMIEHRKQRLETTYNKHTRRNLLNEIVAFNDLREIYPHPKPVSSINKTDEEYRDESHRLNQEYYEQKIAEMNAVGDYKAAKGFQRLADILDREYKEDRAIRRGETPEAETVGAKKTFLNKLFG